MILFKTIIAATNVLSAISESSVFSYRGINLRNRLNQKSKTTYGSRRISWELNDLGFPCGRHKSGTLMKLAGVVAKQRKKFKNRKFSVTTPNCVWVGDIIYIWTSEGWLYLAVVIDLYTRRIVDSSLNKRISRQLVMDALTMAL